MRVRGRGARVAWRTIAIAFAPPPSGPGPSPPPTPPPPTPGGPDLVISSFTGDQFTVRNQGETNAGPFRVRLSSNPTGDTNYDFPALTDGFPPRGRGY